eukprot:scaffold75198_cov55-Attheya_sp.AAC.4
MVKGSIVLPAPVPVPVPVPVPDSPDNNLTRGKSNIRTAQSRGSAKMRRSKMCHSTNDLLGFSSKSKLSLTASYGGPAPEGPDGRPLKGCLSSNNLMARNEHDSSDSTTSTKQQLSKRNVSFHRIEVREYERTLGDHPCSDGVPLSLGWRYSESNLEALDEYEKKREPMRRTTQEMRAPRHVRMSLLKEHDLEISNKDIAKMAKQILETKRNRALSNNESTQRKEAAERIQRRFKGILRVGSSSGIHGKKKTHPSKEQQAHQAAVQHYINHASSFSTAPSPTTLYVAKQEEPVPSTPTAPQIHDSSPSHHNRSSPTWGDHHDDDDDDDDADALSF